MKKVVGLLLASLINKERSMFNLLPVSYDFKLHDYLKDSVTNNGSEMDQKSRKLEYYFAH